MRRRSFFWKLFLSFGFVIFVATAAMQFIVSRRVEDDGRRQIAAALRANSYLLGAIARPAFGGAEHEDLQGRVAVLGRRIGTRLTVIAADGLVLADSDEDPARMEPHDTRPEVLEARERGEGRATRHSATLDREMMYVAVALRDGERLLGFARSSRPVAAVETQVSALGRTVVLGAALALLATLIASALLARRIASPVTAMVNTVREYSAGDYAARVPVSGKDEFAELATAFNAMARQQEERVATLREERNKLEAILAGMVEGVVAVTQDDRVLHMNRVAAELLEVSSLRAHGRTLWELSPPPTLAELLESCRRERRDVNGEIHRPSDEGDRVIEVHASPLAPEVNGGGGGAVLVLHDVTELRRLEKVRRDFVANVSHELKTPLTVIRGIVETMADDPEMPADTRGRFLGKMRGQAEYLSAQVSDLLALSRLESGDKAGRWEKVGLGRVVREVVSLHGPAAEAKSLTLELEPPAGALTVRGDRHGLEQAVSNLLDNAIHYTPTGGRVTVRLAALGEEARCSVSDSGLGIEPEHQERIFERFYRVDRARSREVGGTGLGLAIVKHVALSHGGSVSVESRPGQGSTFTITLPLAD